MLEVGEAARRVKSAFLTNVTIRFSATFLQWEETSTPES